MISNINYGVYRGKRTVSLRRCTHLSVLGRRQLDLCMRFSCEYSGNCIRFSIFAQQNIDSVFYDTSFSCSSCFRCSAALVTR